MRHGNKALEQYRITKGPMASRSVDGNNGAFILPAEHYGETLYVIASDGAGWEHVSISLKSRCPN